MAVNNNIFHAVNVTVTSSILKGIKKLIKIAPDVFDFAKLREDALKARMVILWREPLLLAYEEAAAAMSSQYHNAYDVNYADGNKIQRHD